MVQKIGDRTASVGIGKLGLVTLEAPRVLDAGRLVTAAAEHAAGTDADLSVCVSAAAIGLTIRGSTWRPPGTWRERGRDPVEYGHDVLDDLVRSRVLADDAAATIRVVGTVGAAVLTWVSELVLADARATEADLAPFEPTPPPGGTP